MAEPKTKPVAAAAGAAVAEAPKPATEATAAAANYDVTDIETWADFATLVPATQTKAGMPPLKSLSGKSVFIDSLAQEDKLYVAHVFGTLSEDGKRIVPLEGDGRFTVPQTQAKKIVASLKAKAPTAPGVRIGLKSQKRGIGLTGA